MTLDIDPIVPKPAAGLMKLVTKRLDHKWKKYHNEMDNNPIPWHSVH